MNPNENDPNNKYVPPAPGQYHPQPHDELINEMQQPNPQEIPKPHLDMQDQAAKKRKQARRFIGLAVVFGVICLAGIILLVGAFRSDDPLAVTDQSVDEQLKSDANALGLGIINYNNGNDPFEITPENTAELQLGYVPQDLNDPRTNEPYVLTTAIPKEGEMQYVLGGVCNQDDSVSQGSDPDGFAVRVLLDEDQTLYCLERSEVSQPQQPKP